MQASLKASSLGEVEMNRRNGMGTMAGKILVGGVVALLLMAQLAIGGPKRGAKVEATIKGSSEKVIGELQLVRPGEITIETGGGTDRVIPIQDLSVVRIVRRSAALGGLVLGAAAGGAVCYGLSSASSKDVFMGGVAVAGWTAAGVAVGALIGGIAGGSKGKDRIYDLSNLQPAQYPWITAELQKYARVKSAT